MHRSSFWIREKLKLAHREQLIFVYGVVLQGGFGYVVDLMVCIFSSVFQLIGVKQI